MASITLMIEDAATFTGGNYLARYLSGDSKAVSGKLEGGTKRATDPSGSLKVYSLERVVTKPNKPVIYYLFDWRKYVFVREQLLVVPPKTQLPLQMPLFNIFVPKCQCVH